MILAYPDPIVRVPTAFLEVYMTTSGVNYGLRAWPPYNVEICDLYNIAPHLLSEHMECCHNCSWYRVKTTLCLLLSN